MSSLAALVLAGSRGPGEPLAVYAGVSHKALIEVGGRPMIERVVAALAALPEIGTIAISIERPDLLNELPSLRLAAGSKPLSLLPAAGSPSASVAAALAACGTPLLVTTADHALLRPEWVSYFITHAPADADACVAMARRECVLQALPRTQRTWLRFADGAYSGCNLFLFASPTAAGAVHFWRRIEAERKRPLRMLAQLGWTFVLRYSLGRLPLAAALQRLGRLSGTRPAVVELPFGLAAVDVDKPSDLDLVRELIAGPKTA